MSRYTIHLWKPELGVATCCLCDRPAVADRIGRTAIGICKACALKELPALIADACYPDPDALLLVMREYQRIIAQLERSEQHTRAALPALHREAIAEVGPVAVQALIQKIAPGAASLDDLNDVQVSDLSRMLTEMLGQTLNELWGMT